jgi:hypothetical protein
MPNLRDASLMLSILLMGILLGGIVYAHIVYFPPYLSDLPASSVLVNGPYALHEEYFWLTIHPIAILSLIVSLAVNWKDNVRRKLIAIPLTVYTLALVVTTLYFVPELQNFARSATMNVSPEEWYARGQRWQHMSWIRGTFLVLSYIPLLFALQGREVR